MRAGHHNRHQRELEKAFRHAELTVQELWLRYFALGGDAGPTEVDAYVHGLMPFSQIEHNVLALAVNERLNELPPPRAPYSRSDKSSPFWCWSVPLHRTPDPMLLRRPGAGAVSSAAGVATVKVIESAQPAGEPTSILLPPSQPQPPLPTAKPSNDARIHEALISRVLRRSTGLDYSS